MAGVMASVMLLLVVATVLLYSLRQLIFTINRLTGVQRHPFMDISMARWPVIAVLVTVQNNEQTIARCIEALLNTDYPSERLKIILITDRSKNSTTDIVDSYVVRFPLQISAFYSGSSQTGKAAALNDALLYAKGDIALTFDAGDIPSRGLIKQLVAPFFDPEVGAVMGRVVPVNGGTNLLTRLLDLDHAADYQVAQQARMNMNLLAQYAGTVGGVRLSAVLAVGGWRDDAFAADTDLTVRLMLNGWKTAYTNRAECYEELPQEWSVRIKQMTLWAKGHHQMLTRYGRQFANRRYLTLGQRIDGLLLLFAFVMPLIMLMGWCVALGLYFINAGSLLSQLIPVFVMTACSTLRNFAAFFKTVAAVLIDGNRRRLRLLPFNLLVYFVYLFVLSGVVWRLLFKSVFKSERVIEKNPPHSMGGL